MNSNPVARSALREILLVTQHGHYNNDLGLFMVAVNIAKWKNNKCFIRQKVLGKQF